MMRYGTKKVLIGVIILVFSAGGFFTFRYLALFEKKIPSGMVQETGDQGGSMSGDDLESSRSFPLEVETVVTGLVVPWSLAFTSDTRMLVTERPGRVRVVEDGVLQSQALFVFPEVSSDGEEGLMGLALDPEYESNRFIYVSLAYKKGADLVVKVVRLIDQGSEASDPETLIDALPAAEFHAGSRIKFGPDKMLYITTGDATDKNIAQDLNSLGGKILRIHPDGTIPTDNPWVDSPVWSYGHRNSQGIAWHPLTGEMYATEHGPSVFDGPAGGDEVNRIVKGVNYGWPLVSHERKRSGTESPLLVFTPAEAPAGATFYTSSQIPQFANQFFFAALKGEGIFRVAFDTNNPDVVKEYEKLSEVNVGRIRDVVEGPDGALYFLTSNRDGRGNPASRDDRIMRIVPKK